MNSLLRLVGIAWAAIAVLGLARPGNATTVLARGVVSGVTTVSPVLEIADAPPIGDLVEFQAFYAASAVGSGGTLDYDGEPPILEEDLVPGAAHLFFLEKSGEMALFVVYKRLESVQSVDGAVSSSAGAFNIGDYVVRDAPEDTHDIVGGALSTSHRITVGGRTDGYVASLAGRFDEPGDVLVFDMVTPSLAHLTDDPFSGIQVFGGLDGLGDPIWIEIDAGPFAAFGSGRVELTRQAPMPVPGLGAVGLLTVAFSLGHLGVRRTVQERETQPDLGGRGSRLIECGVAGFLELR